MPTHNDSNYGIEEENSILHTPLGRWIYGKYFGTINDFLAESAPKGLVLDAGCAGGDTLLAMRKSCPYTYLALDISWEMIKNSVKKNPQISHIQGSLYELPFPNNAVDTTVSTQVLEHMDTPEKAMAEIARVTRKCAIISVPNEPFFRAANLVRLRHLSRLGSTPGHIQHYGRRSFKRMLSEFFPKVTIKTILGIWNVALCFK